MRYTKKLVCYMWFFPTQKKNQNFGYRAGSKPSNTSISNHYIILTFLNMALFAFLLLSRYLSFIRVVQIQNNNILLNVWTDIEIVKSFCKTFSDSIWKGWMLSSRCNSPLISCLLSFKKDGLHRLSQLCLDPLTKWNFKRNIYLLNMTTV